MIEIHAPGFRDLQVSHVVCDYNGTLTVDGEILLGVHDSLTSPALDVDIRYHGRGMKFRHSPL